MFSIKDYIEKPANGVYKGIVQEDAINTIKDTNELYIDVWIEDFYPKHKTGEEPHYPLTRIPSFMTCYNLQKDDVVWVKFDFDDLTLPYIYKIDKTYNEIKLKDGVTNFIKLGNDEYVYIKDKKNLSDKELVLEVKESIITIKANGDINISANNVNINSNKCTINNHLEVT